MDKRVTICSTNGQSKLVNITGDMKFEDFLELSSKKLGVTAKRVFNKGSEVDGVDVIRDGDMLNITDAAGLPTPGSKSQHLLKIAVIGPGGVGKSAITVQYVQGRFLVDYDPTIEDAHRKQVVIDGQSWMLDILDTAGQEDYTVLRGQWMQEKEGFIMVYSVLDRRTFEEVQAFYDQLRQIHDVCPPLVLLANKVDMPPEKRQVSKFEGEQMAQRFNNAIFLESSAKTGQNIDNAFITLVREITKRRGSAKSGKVGWASRLASFKKGDCVVL